MSLPKQYTSPSRDFKHRILVCLHKLSDRDTHSAAVTELESIAKTLTHDSIPPFLSSISVTDASDKSPVRKQCVRLISTLSEAHGDVLSPYLSKLISAVIRRLRDPDTVIRSACVAATGSIASHITKPPFTAVAKPLVDALVTEQDSNSQIGAALCLASVINGAPDPDTAYLRRLLPRIEKLLKNNSFKAKTALLSVVTSVISVGAASNPVVVRNLVTIMVEFVAKSEDWTVRKAAAEVLEKLAVVETDLLPEFKSSCLKTFEAKKFDKVKGVRETMNQMIEAWNAIPDLLKEEVSPPPGSHSSKEEADVRNPPQTPQIMSKRISLDGSSTTSATRRSLFETSSRKTGPAMFRKLDRKKPNEQKLDTPVCTPPGTMVTKDDSRLKRMPMKQEMKRALFSEISDEKIYEPQYYEERSSSRDAGGNADSNINLVPRDSEDLSLIRNQLAQIENRQSNLFDLLEKFIGSSQNGMRSLESRVHGLESTLDEISFDLAKSTGRVSKPAPTLCCKLPGADLLSSKLWKKTEIQHSSTRYSSSPSVKNKNHESYNLHNSGFRLQGGGSGIIKNPLAEVHQM